MFAFGTTKGLTLHFFFFNSLAFLFPSHCVKVVFSVLNTPLIIPETTLQAPCVAGSQEEREAILAHSLLTIEGEYCHPNVSSPQRLGAGSDRNRHARSVCLTGDLFPACCAPRRSEKASPAGLQSKPISLNAD